MGLFDSYHLPWADGQIEVQTKELDPAMRGFSLGSRVPLDDEFRDPPDFFCLHETLSLSPHWEDASQNRSIVLAHWEGIFCDFATVLDGSELPFAESALASLWNNPGWRSEGLSRLLDIARQELAREHEQGLAQRRLHGAWTRELEARKARRDNAPEHPLAAFGLSLDFSDKSLEARWAEIFASSPALALPIDPPWRAASCPPPPPPPPPLDPRLCGGWGAGEPERPRLRRLPEIPSQQAACEALIEALGQGRLDRARSACEQWPEAARDARARQALFAWLPKACLSRQFCHEAARLMIASGAFPPIAIPGAAPVEALDWLASRTGAQSGAIEALIQADAPASPAFPFHLLRRDYLPLLPLALGARSVEAPRDALGRGLLEAALGSRSPEAVEAVLELGADPLAIGANGEPLALAAIKLAASRAGHGFAAQARAPEPPATPEEACALALIARGALELLEALPGPEGSQARAALTPTLARAFAQRERSALALEAAKPAPLPPGATSGAARVAPRSI